MAGDWFGWKAGTADLSSGSTVVRDYRHSSPQAQPAKSGFTLNKRTI